MDVGKCEILYGIRFIIGEIVVSKFVDLLKEVFIFEVIVLIFVM